VVCFLEVELKLQFCFLLVVDIPPVCLILAMRTKKTPKKVSRTDNLFVNKRNNLVVVPRSSGLIVPDRMYTRLRFFGATSITVTAATPQGAVRYRPTAAFDVDPLLASTATPGFAEFAAFYNTYRVTASNARIVMSQRSSESLVGVLAPVLFDPGASPTYNTIASWSSTPFSKHMQIPPIGGDSITLAQSMSTEKIHGTDMVYYDNNFAATVTGIPGNNWYWVVGILASPAPAANTVVNVMVDIEMGVEFYDRKALTS
jgi:hypothetical protein